MFKNGKGNSFDSLTHIFGCAEFIIYEKRLKNGHINPSKSKLEPLFLSKPLNSNSAIKMSEFHIYYHNFQCFAYFG